MYGRLFIVALANSPNVLVGLSVHFDRVAFVDEHWCRDGGTGFEGHELVSALCGVTAEVWRSLGYLELHFDREADTDWFIVKEETGNLTLFFEVQSLITKDILGKRHAFCGSADLVEPELTLGLVDVHERTGLDFGFLGLFGDMEGVLSHLAGDEVLEFGGVHRLALLLAKDVRIEHLVGSAIHEDDLSDADIVIDEHCHKEIDLEPKTALPEYQMALGRATQGLPASDRKE
jgi:hypothetical protein